MGRNKRRKHWFDNAHKDDPVTKLHQLIGGEMKARQKHSTAVKAIAITILGVIFCIVVTSLFYPLPALFLICMAAMLAAFKLRQKGKQK